MPLEVKSDESWQRVAFAGVETLAYVFAEIHGADRKDCKTEEQDAPLAKYLVAWDRHRHERVAAVLDFTSKNGTLRKSSP